VDSKNKFAGAVSANKRGLKMISDVAKLMLRCAGYLSDRQAETNGWKVFYAVDADVIKLYLAPTEKSEYATVFGEAEHADTRNLLARMMGDFIFRDFRSAGANGGRIGALFTVPPHNEELKTIIFALSRRLIDAADQVERKMDVVLAQLCARVKGDEPTEVAQWLIDAAPMLVEVFDGRSGPRAELARFEALEESRLLNLERYEENSPPWAFPLPRLEDNPEDFEDFKNVFSAWKERLAEHKSFHQSPKGVIRDAYALATIELLNKRMSSEHRKLVLVTGTHSILTAAKDHLVQQTGQPPDSFADLYIRHPQSFMADASFFGSGPGGEPSLHTDSAFNLMDWLDLFFPNAAQESSGQRTPLIDRAVLREFTKRTDTGFHDAVNLLAASESAGGQKNGFPESILNEWRTQVHTASVSRNIDSPESGGMLRARDLINWLRERIDQGFTLQQLRTDLAKRAVQSLSSLYSSTSWLGLWSSTGPIRDRIRGIPALRFDGDFQLARDYCQKVVDAMRASSRGHEEGKAVNVDMAEVYSRLFKIDDSHYHGHVIHALAYATKGDWHATQTLCRIALRTADGLPDREKRDRKGREGAYLLAIAERRLALKVKDLDVAKRYLEEAELRDNVGGPKDNRFLSEAIAIDIAKLNFKVFVGKDRSSVFEELERVLPRAVELLKLTESDPLKPAREWVRQQVLTNVLNLALIARDENLTLPQATLDHVCFFVSAANDNLLQGGSFARDRDAVAEFIYLAAAIVFGSDPTARRAAMTKLNDLNFPTYSPFDKTREATFRQLAARAVLPESAPS
jgi:hypothetical protein